MTLAGAARACTGSRIRIPGEAGKEIITKNDLCVRLSPAPARHDLENSYGIFYVGGDNNTTYYSFLNKLRIAGNDPNTYGKHQ